MASYLDSQGARYIRLTDYDLESMAMDESSSSVAKARFESSPTAATKAKDTLQFLKLVLLIAISPVNPEIIEKLQTLPLPTQDVIAALIQEVAPSRPLSDDEDGAENSDLDSREKSSRRSGASSPVRRKDRELVLEEDLASVNAQLARRESEVEDLKAENREISNQYIRLRDNYEAIKELSAENEDQLKKLSLVHNEREQWSVRDLEAKISQLEETIGRQESQIVEYQSNEAEMERKVNKLRNADDKLQKLQDDFHIQKAKLEEQTKRANRGDNYKRKCEANQHIERERDSLRQQLDEARPRLQAYDDIRRDNVRLQQENHEIGHTLSRSERDNNELRETKQAYLAEINRLHQDSKAMREVLAQGQERIADLEDRSSGSEIHSSPTVVDGGLESELAETSKHEEQMQVASILLFWNRALTMDRKTRIVELEKQTRQLANDASEKETKLIALQRQLKSAQELSADQEKQVQGMRQEVSNLHSSIEEVRQGHPIEGFVSSAPDSINIAHNVGSTETFKKMRQQLKTEQKRRGELEEKLSAAQKAVEAANDERTSSFERHCLMTDLNVDLFEGALIDKPKLEMIEEIKKQYGVAIMQLQNEHDALRLRHTVLQGQLDKRMDERNEAWHEAHKAVVAKAQADSDNRASSQGLVDLKNMIKNLSEDKSGQSTSHINEALERNVDIFATKIEEGRERLAKQQQVSKQFSSNIPTHDLPLTQPSFPPGTPSQSTKRASKVLSSLFKRAEADKNDNSKSKSKIH